MSLIERASGARKRPHRLGSALLTFLLLSCGSTAEETLGTRSGSGGSPAAGTGGSGGGLGGVGGTSSAGSGFVPVAGTGGTGIPVAGADGAGSGGTNVCATATATTSLEDVHLAFAFDVSGSMGKGDFPWHDEELKWVPVVEATRAFFEDEASAGFYASLTAFPVDEDEDDRCDPESYTEPDVPMTELPSGDFGAELDAIRDDGWRGGTPTLAVVTGTLAFIDEYRADHPGRYAFVLVTDGYPQDCDDDDDDIAEVADAVRAVAGEIPTYVVGVKNPPLEDDEGNLAPDTTSDLELIAEAGGTGTAFFIDTGDPTRTSAAFKTAIDLIRGVSVACNLSIPLPPDGRDFVRENVRVSYTSGAAESELAYDPDCVTPLGWHYDDFDAPTEVVLCDAVCESVQSDPEAALSVDFTCQPVIEVPR